MTKKKATKKTIKIVELGDPVIKVPVVVDEMTEIPLSEYELLKGFMKETGHPDDPVEAVIGPTMFETADNLLHDANLTKEEVNDMIKAELGDKKSVILSSGLVRLFRATFKRR